MSKKTSAEVRSEVAHAQKQLNGLKERRAALQDLIIHTEGRVKALIYESDFAGSEEAKRQKALFESKARQQRDDLVSLETDVANAEALVSDLNRSFETAVVDELKAEHDAIEADLLKSFVEAVRLGKAKNEALEVYYAAQEKISRKATELRSHKAVFYEWQWPPFCGDDSLKVTWATKRLAELEGKLGVGCG